MHHTKIAVFRSLTIAGLCFLGTLAPAQEYPTKSIRFVVPNAPGGGTDLMARVISQKLSEAWGHAVVVENRAGGTGAVGSVFVAKSPADGYSLLLVTSSTHAISPALQSNLPYDPVKDFAPVSLVATGPQVLVMHPSVPAKTAKELVALAKSRPNGLNYASAGVGSLGHMGMELFKSVAGMKIVHVAYKGTGAAITDELSGYVQLMFSGPGAVIAHVQARKLKAIVVANPKRTVGFEDVPTFAEAGYPAVEAAQWYGVVTTAGTPSAVVTKLNREIVRILKLPDPQSQFLANGYTPDSNTPEEFSQLIRKELAKWQKVVKETGIRVE